MMPPLKANLSNNITALPNGFLFAGLPVNSVVLWMAFYFLDITIALHNKVTPFPLKGNTRGRKVIHKQISIQENRADHNWISFFSTWVRLG